MKTGERAKREALISHVKRYGCVGSGNEQAAFPAAMLRDIRALGDFDLRMFLSEIADHGYECAIRLLSQMATRSDA